MGPGLTETPDFVLRLAIEQLQRFVTVENTFRASRYSAEHSGWVRSHGGGDPGPEPQPPRTMVLVFDEADLPHLTEGPLMAALPSVPNNPSMVVDISTIELKPGVFLRGPRDTAPVGHVHTEPRGTFRKALDTSGNAGFFGGMQVWIRQ